MPSTEFHPDLRRIAKFIPKQAVTPVTLPLMRLLTRMQSRHVPDGVEVLTLPSGVGVRLYRPADATGEGPALLWIHGGGYIIGTPAQDDVLCRRYASELGATVASVDYRLAPEHPYPAPLEDCYAALKWLASLPSVDPARVAVGGGSAGGGLAASLALLARDRGEVPLVAQLLVYPMLDDRTVDRDLDNPGHRLWNQSSNRFGWSAYLGDADRTVAVPARRDDLSGLPPAWIGVGALDLFHDEDLAYAERLRAAGVPCRVEVVEGAFHGFDAILPKAEVSVSFFNSQCALLREAFAPAAA
ncbi:alpha/beta hydrolase [Mycobacterium deserti]|uniref:Alpha/beta hydrolase n=1 Tax=Mycobacterium deserti TaxID=2978347 RepID=A0ABT2M9F9_9MYCO|nr:alpha/beta hydrolase [Mycobacterium deserti]MCT7658887.1 alpha/beta hydrolase [Mycobacterium deserti]